MRFKPDEKVSVLLLIPCHSLQANYLWPYVIESRLNDLIYIVNTHVCDVGVGAVLLPEGKDDIDLPNFYFS